MFTLFVETVDACDGSWLVIPSKDEYLIRVFYLIGVQQTNGLDALPSSIYVIAQEEVRWLRREAPVFKKSEHVVVLAMNVAAYFDWGWDLYQHGLLQENILDSPDESQYFSLCDFDKFPRFRRPNF